MTAEKTARCRELVQAMDCKYYKSSQEKVDRIDAVYRGKVMDIEEWKKEGVSEKFCPFYANRSMVESSNVVVLPFEALGDESQVDLISEHARDSIVVVENSESVPGHDGVVG